MKNTFDTIILGTDLDSAITTVVEEARWGSEKDPNRLALALKHDRVVVLDRPTHITAEKWTGWVTGRLPVPEKYRDAVEQARKLALAPNGPVLATPLAYTEATETLQRMGVSTHVRRPAMFRVIGTVSLDPRHWAGRIRGRGDRHHYTK